MRLLNSSEKLYEGIQVVNHIITVAATKSTTESVYNSNSWKNYREQAMRDSFEVQKADGPLFTRCDSMVKTFLDKYVSDKKWVAFYNVREFVENFKADFKIRSEEDCSHAW